MNVKEVVEEIQEKSDNFLSVQSILRKITNVRDNLIRNYGPAQQQSDVVVSQFDLLNGQAQYPLPCPPSNVVDVEVKGLFYGEYAGWFSMCECTSNWIQPQTFPITEDEEVVPEDCWFRLPYKQFDQNYYGPYYYFLSGIIGLVPKPCKDVEGGLKIFHIPVLSPLTIENLEGSTGFDPNFDMVLVYGVLKDITNGAQAAEYMEKYKQWLYDYQTANSGFERYVVDERW